MIEDDAYRTSSQYRYWSYTREALAALRQSTNALASERVIAAIRRSKADHASPEHDGAEPPDKPIETLTTDEELKIVKWGCARIVEMGQVMEPPVPMEIRATAIQYLRRFYLSNSPMTYHPKQIMMCALFLATKSDHWHIPLHNFVSKLPNVSEDDVKAPEFLLMQGLRFTLDVRHPMRGLEGGIGEILAMVEDGSIALKEKDTYAAQRRVGAAADKASNLLRTAAQMTDAYFLYTPAQMWLSALQVADPDLTSTFLKEKLNLIGPDGVKIHEKLSEVLKGCAELLASYKSPDDDSTEKKEMRRIGKKLHLCQNPEKIDLVAVTKAKAAEKRDGVNGNGAEQALKKRKLERKGLQKDDDVYRPHHHKTY